MLSDVGKDATINGVNVLEIVAGDNVNLRQSGNVLAIDVTDSMPPLTEEDNGKVLGVVDGAVAAVAPSGIAVVEKILTTGGWTVYNSYYGIYKQTVAVDGVTGNPRQAIFKDVELAELYNDGNAAILTAWNGANGQGPANFKVEQTEGQLAFFCKDKPTVNIPLLIAVATPPAATGALFEFSVYHTWMNDYEGGYATYRAREGMTWAEWCASEYNTGEFRDDGYGNIYDSNYDCVYYDLDDYDAVDRTDVIEARTYVAASDGS